MSSVGETKPEIFFDITEGKLLVGSAAVESAVESGVHAADIRELAPLLTQEERVIGPDVFPSIQWQDWDKTNDVIAAKWLHNVISNYNPRKALSEEVVTRAGYMGLVPRIHYFKSRPGKLSGLYREADLKGTRTRNLFDSWSTGDYVAYIHRLANELGDKPSFDDLRAAGLTAGNPQTDQINRHFNEGGLGALFELAGYPNVKAWSKQDYVDWGVRFTLANDGQLPDARSMALLSSRCRGPHYSSIYDNIGSLSDYRVTVSEEFKAEIERRAARQESQLYEIKSDIDAGNYPEFLYQEAKNETEAVRTHARYRLIEYLLPDIQENSLLYFARIRRPERLIAFIKNADPYLSTAEIEVAASTLDIFDDIWPLDDYMKFLKV
jgi:hypothetical protein